MVQVSSRWRAGSGPLAARGLLDHGAPSIAEATYYRGLLHTYLVAGSYSAVRRQPRQRPHSLDGVTEHLDDLLCDIVYMTSKVTSSVGPSWPIGSVPQPFVCVTAMQLSYMRISKADGTAPQCQGAVPAVPPAARPARAPPPHPAHPAPAPGPGRPDLRALPAPVIMGTDRVRHGPAETASLTRRAEARIAPPVADGR